MEPLQLIRTLQFTDSFFPVGAFAYSDGLETAACNGQVRDAASLERWMDWFLNGVFIPCEGLALVKCMRALKAGDEATTSPDRSGTQRNPAGGSRARRKHQYGQTSAFPLSNDAWKRTADTFAGIQCCRRVRVCFLSLRAWKKRTPRVAYGYNRLTGIVSAGLRLIPIGHQQGQALLTKAIDRLPDAVNRILAKNGEPLRSFSPMLDIHQMNHQYLYSRLFRS